jgi:dTDP-4-dehydrorhamnose 3,5-epimerase
MAVPTTEVTGHKTAIPGLLWFDVTRVEDDRGWYQESYQKSKLIAAGLPESFSIVQNSFSYNKKRGVTRGFHAEPWDKYITVIKGRVFVAYADLRASETFGHVVTLEITPTKAVYLPKGVANSFQTLEDDTYYIYSMNDLWSAEKYDEYTFVNLADPTLGVAWPIPLDQAIMSERDKNHPLISHIKPMEINHG